jgi:nucleoside-diphosphate-sugar epimerase
MTRSQQKAEHLHQLGALPVVCDVFDAASLTDAVTLFKPEAVMHQLTDLPDSVDQLGEFAARNDRMRTEGTRNLISAARAAIAHHLLAQSIAWRPPGRGEVVDAHERQVLDAGGVVVRYGQLYGPSTYYEDRLPPHPPIHVDDAARATPAPLQARSGVVTLADDTSEG